MKSIYVSAIILVAGLLFIPMIVFAQENIPQGGTQAKQTPQDSAVAVTAKAAATDYFRVLDTSTQKVSQIPADDYICGVVAGEMPALYDPEALKAQAVAAYTFACRRRAEAGDRNYDISTDHTTDQTFVSKEAAQEKWGENAETYLTKIRNAVTEVSGYMVTYGGEPALTVYHAISSGRTESVTNVWGGSYPYLMGVDSPGDKLSPKYLSTLTISAEDLKQKLGGLATISGDAANWFSDCKTTAAGMVKEIMLCNKKVTGSQIRAALDLRSSCFTVKYSDNQFTFTVKGYGHGVGMSQNGANYMAQQGSSFKEILCWYYPGCKVVKVKS